MPRRYILLTPRLRSGYISSPARSIHPLLHPIKNLLIHKSLMSPPDNHPLLFRKTLLPLPFIKGLPPASLYHMPQINLAGKNVFYGRRLPHSGCVPLCFRLPLLITVTGRRRDFPPVQFFRYLPECFSHGDNADARAQMSLAALEAGISFNNASVTVIHGMSRPIGALFHVPHGVSNAMLLSACFEYVYREAADRFADLGRAIGAAGAEESDEKAAEKFIQACRELCISCGIPTLEEYGIDREVFMESIPKMTKDAIASGSPANTRKELSQEDITTIYKALWS